MASCKRLAVPALAMIMITLLVPFSPSFPQTRPWLFSVFGYSSARHQFCRSPRSEPGIEGPIKGLLTSRILTFLGRRCYGLYLWHVLAAGLAIVALQQWEVGFYAHMVLWLAILLILASASWLLFEEPILRLKRFLPYRERQPLQSESHTAASSVSPAEKQLRPAPLS